LRFWDASAVVPLLIAEPSTADLQATAASDPAMLVWWGTEIECASALARLEREDALDEAAATQAFTRLGQLATAWHEVEPTDAVRVASIRFLRVHPLRAAEAQQLAAAFIAAGNRPASLTMVTLDDRLATAARKEGFSLYEIPAR
jgi:predicted nucleic acid-binding protein